MVNNKLFFFIAFLLLVLPSINAEVQTLGTFIVDSNINLIQVCDNCTYVNLTSVKLPNSTIISYNINMTEVQSTYNFTFTQTDTLGNYIYTTCGDPDGVFTCSSINFEVTNSGSIISTGESIIYIIFTIMILFTFLICLWGAVTIPFKNQVNAEGKIVSVNDLKYLKIFLIVVCYLLLFFIFGITRSITANFLFLNGANKVFHWLYSMMLATLFPAMVLTLLFTIILYIQSKKLKEALMRGVPIR